MAIYRYWTGGNNAGGANNSNWAEAYNTLAGVFAVATTSSDIVLGHYTSQENVSGSTTWTQPAGVALIFVDKDNGEVYTPMGTSGWIGNSSQSRTTIFNASAKVCGLTMRNAGANNFGITLAAAQNSVAPIEDLFIWNECSSTGNLAIPKFNAVQDRQACLRIKNLKLFFGSTGQALRCGGFIEINGGSIHTGSSIPDAIISGSVAVDTTGTVVLLNGFDASPFTGASLVGDSAITPLHTTWTQCILPSGYSLVATQTATGAAGATVELRQCRQGSTNGIWAYANSLGSVVLDTGITYGGESASWRITTTAAASEDSPFITPWVFWYDKPTTSCTLRFEILRDGSTTPWTTAQVSSEWMLQQSGGPSFLTDRAAPNGTPANLGAGSGLTDWAGKSGTAWSGQTNTGAAVTPVADFDLLGRIVVAVASTTVYASMMPRA